MVHGVFDFEPRSTEVGLNTFLEAGIPDARMASQSMGWVARRQIVCTVGVVVAFGRLRALDRARLDRAEDIR